MKNTRQRDCSNELQQGGSRGLEEGRSLRRCEHARWYADGARTGRRESPLWKPRGVSVETLSNPWMFAYLLLVVVLLRVLLLLLMLFSMLMLLLLSSLVVAAAADAAAADSVAFGRFLVLLLLMAAAIQAQVREGDIWKARRCR